MESGSVQGGKCSKSWEERRGREVGWGDKGRAFGRFMSDA